MNGCATEVKPANINQQPVKPVNEEINIINATLPLIVPHTVNLKQKPQGNLTSEHYRIQLKIDSIKRKKNSKTKSNSYC